MGSLFYVAYAVLNGEFPEAERVWAIVGLVIVGSIAIHGIAATPVMALVDERRARRAGRRGDGTAPETVPV